jgi:ATP-dependent Lhr-like helicase
MGGNAERILRYTGDHHDIENPESAFVVIATPEALDSLQLTMPTMLDNVRAIIFDEIHFLHGNARGQQLRYVASRIKGNSRAPASHKDVFQLIGMSASINDLEQVKEIWIGKEAVIIANKDRRCIEMTYVKVPADKIENNAGAIAAAIRKWIESVQMEKVLIFANTRNEAHMLSIALNSTFRGSQWTIFLHIGILSAPERDRVENEMKTCRAYICVATSTLEIGIDIGAIDAVLLLSPPSSVSVFLQRIGRGNRRSDICRVIAFYRSDIERLLYKAMLNLAETGFVDGPYEYDRPSVRFQQVLSLAWHGVRSGNPLTIRNISEKTGGFSHDDVIHDMLSQGFLIERQKALIPSDDLMDEGDRRNIHTVIGAPAGRQIIDAKTGQIVARSEGQIGKGLVFLDGHLKEIKEPLSDRVFLETKDCTSKQTISKLPATRGKLGLSWIVCWELAKQLNFDPHRWDLSNNYLRTWGGKVNNQILAHLCKSHGIKEALKADDFGVNGILPEHNIDLDVVTQWIESFDRATSFSFKDATWFKEPTAYYSKLGTTLRKTEAFNSIPIQEFVNWLNACKT